MHLKYRLFSILPETGSHVFMTFRVEALLRSEGQLSQIVVFNLDYGEVNRFLLTAL